MLKAIPKEYFMDPNKGVLKLLWEEEWRALGITQVQLLYHQIDQTYTNTLIEPRVGALRSSRTRATYPLIQV
jgi:hypothetical protein